MDDMLDQHFSDDRSVKIVNSRSQNGWYEKNLERYKDPEYRKRVSKSISEAYQTEQGREKQRLKALKTASEATRQKLREANLGKKRRGQDWVAKMAATKLGNGYGNKPFHTPSGIFPSKRLAADWATAQGLCNANGKFDRWLKKRPDEFYYITREQFDQLPPQIYNADLDWLKNSKKSSIQIAAKQKRGNK
jgi:hypothetical protein